MDVDSIEPGLDFREVIAREVAKCHILLAIIGPQWLTLPGEEQRRLDDPNDIVRLEIEAALERDIRVVPILVEGATMPRSSDLPQSLQKLEGRHALRISHESFRRDAGQLLETLDPLLLGSKGVGAKSKPKTSTKRRIVAKAKLVQRGKKSRAIEISLPQSTHTLEYVVIGRPFGQHSRISIDDIEIAASESRYRSPNESASHKVDSNFQLQDNDDQVEVFVWIKCRAVTHTILGMRVSVDGREVYKDGSVY
jgi:hypothetical protein